MNAKINYFSNSISQIRYNLNILNLRCYEIFLFLIDRRKFLFQNINYLLRYKGINNDWNRRDSKESIIERIHFRILKNELRKVCLILYIFF